MILKNIFMICLLVTIHTTNSFSSTQDDHLAIGEPAPDFSLPYATILAISGDYVFSHYEWAKQQNFPFKLLSDHHHEVGKLYDSYIPERGFNRRTVFVIDQKGRIA